MNKDVPVVNRVIQKRQLEKNKDMLVNKIMTMKFSNISALKASPNSIKHRPHPHPIEYNRVVSSTDHKQTTVKTVLARQNMRSQNKKIYDRLVRQKSTVSAKVFADQRQRNVQFLKRIGRYPYNKMQSMKLQPLNLNDEQPNDRQFRSSTFGNEQTERINIRLSDNSLSKHKAITSPFPEEQRKQYMIVLYSKVVRLNKNWFEVRFVRFKNHYQIFLQPYPQSRIEYTLRLQEDIGTAMLSQNDYDYEIIYTNYIKFTNQYVCFAFELAKPEKKKHFFRFQKRNKNEPALEKFALSQKDEQPVQQQSVKTYRKTMFALQNQKLQKREQQSRFKRFKTDVSEINNPMTRLETVSSLDIRIMG